MLSNVLYFAGAFAMAWLISSILIAALIFIIQAPEARLLTANGIALVVCELLYRTVDARFFFARGVVIYAAAQVACLLSQWLLLRASNKTDRNAA